MIVTTGCGDLFMKDSPDSGVDLSQFASCELDIEAFSHILDQNIKGDILCLRDKLHMFMDTVETDRPGYISKKVLQDFLVNGPIDVEDDVVDIVDSVFDLSFVIIGTERNYIKRNDVDVLLNFLVYFNEHIWKSHKYFNSKKKVNYSTHIKERKIIYNEFSLIANKLKSIYKDGRNSVDEIDSEEFIVNFFQKEPVTLDKIRNLMFLKRVFLGGDVWKLTNIEFKNILDIMPDLAQVAFDVVKTEYFEFDDKQRKMIEVYLRDVEIVKSNLFFNDTSHENVFTVDNIIQAVTALVPAEDLAIDIGKYPNELRKIKAIALGSDDNFFSAREVSLAVEHGVNILEEASFFYKAYNYPLFNEVLNSTERINSTFDFSVYPVRSTREEQFLIHFAQIAQNYKLFKGSNPSATFDFQFHRNPNGVIEIGILEYAIKLVMERYGQKNPNARGGVDMTLDQTVALMEDVKIFLKDEGIITVGRVGGGEVANTADNLVLMSTLFQYQSDGCDEETSCMEVPELTEFIVGLFTALEVKDFFTDTMLALCSDELDEFDRIAPICFRRNFIKVLETKIEGDHKSISEYMPLFYNYLNELLEDLPEGGDITESRDYMDFIQETEAFTRTCTHYDDEKTEEIPLKGNDAFAAFAGLLNIESTMLKFDLNQNGQLDGKVRKGQVNEVTKAYYEVYEGAMKALVAPNGGFKAKLAKPIFLYLINKGIVPDESSPKSMWKFFKFLIRKKKQPANAKRMTIATILKTLGEQSENSIKYPFKCDECLRNPNIECIPEDGAWE
jgi:hypothetical protein